MTIDDNISDLKRLFNKYELDLPCTDSLCILATTICMLEELKNYKGSFDNMLQVVRNETIDDYSSKLWQVIEKATIDCKLDFTIDDLHNLEIIIKGLAEELKENKYD